MNKQTLEELVVFFEQRKLPDLAQSLKQDLKTLPAKESNKENEGRILNMIRKALKKDEERKVKEELKDAGIQQLRVPGQQKMNFSFNKEETEEIMEKLMNKIVAKPNLITDDKLNAKIEKIFNVEAFQKMVEVADIFQDLTSSSLFNQSEL